MKDIHKNPAANIILNGKRLDAFPLRLRMTQGCLLLPVIQHSAGSSS